MVVEFLVVAKQSRPLATAKDQQINVGGFVTVLGEIIDLPPEFFNQFATTNETLQCSPEGTIVIERTGQVFQ